MGKSSGESNHTCARPQIRRGFKLRVKQSGRWVIHACSEVAPSDTSAYCPRVHSLATFVTQKRKWGHSERRGRTACPAWGQCPAHLKPGPINASLSTAAATAESHAAARSTEIKGFSGSS